MEIEIPNYENDNRLSVASRKFLKVLNNTGLPPIESLDVERARQLLSSVQLEAFLEEIQCQEYEKIIDTFEGKIKINIVKPKGQDKKSAAFVFIHGGGWALGDFPTHRRMVNDLVHQSSCTGIFINYSKTPQYAFPKQINEIYAVLQWLSEKGDEISIDASRLAVVGNSVGGNMATVSCMMAKENKGPDIKLQVLMLPVVNANFQTNSFKSYGKDRFLTTDMMKWMYGMYVPDKSYLLHRHASPLMSKIQELEGMPPALIQVAENDILRDDAEAYGRRLDEAGVEVSTLRYNGTIHDFSLLNGLSNTPQNRSLFMHASAELKKRLI